jgi:hypothetical protein
METLHLLTASSLTWPLGITINQSINQSNSSYRPIFDSPLRDPQSGSANVGPHNQDSTTRKGRACVLAAMSYQATTESSPPAILL